MLNSDIFYYALFTLGFSIIIGVPCLKVLVWSLNKLFFGNSESPIAPPSFVKSAVINVVPFALGFILLALEGSMLKALKANPTEHLTVSVEYLFMWAAFAVMLVLTWRMLPTSFPRALLIAFTHSIVMFFAAAAVLGAIFMYAYSVGGKH